MFENFEDFIKGIQMGLDAAKIEEQHRPRWNEMSYDQMREDADYKKREELNEEGERQVLNYIKARLGFQTDCY